MTTHQRVLGGLHGSLIGDALGVPVEFRSREDRRQDPVTGMRDYGTHGQPAGTWSDDGALLLCATESLVQKGFDTQDMGERFLRWYSHGLWTAHGTLFDIGHTTRKALNLIDHGCRAELAGGTEEHSNGNGSLMRILPVALASWELNEAVVCDQIGRASAITHGHERSKLACAFHAFLVRALLKGATPQEALEQTRALFRKYYTESPELGAFLHLLEEDIASKPEAEIESSGYVMDTLTASLWCLLTTQSFAECVLKAVNLGDDTDTTGCVAGGLAGVYYGVDAIPEEWTSKLPRQEDLAVLFERFLERRI
jgi:ADP-ribosyl-[dinitrogen reductase] hydrolase